MKQQKSNIHPSGNQQRTAPYQHAIDEARKDSGRLTGRINRVVSARLISFLLAAGSAWWGIHHGNVIFWIPVGLFFFLFLGLIRYHQHLIYNRNILSEIIHFNEGEINSLKGDYSGFDPGTEYNDPLHPYVSDLDVFGEGTIFPFLNRTTTLSGKLRLSEKIKTAGMNVEEILETQDAIRELAEKFSWRQLFFATGRVMKEEKNDEIRLKEILASVPLTSSPGMLRVVSYIIPVTVITVILLYILKIVPYQVPMLALIFPALIEGVLLKRINRYHARLSEGIRLLRKYEKLLILIEKETFHSKRMSRMKDDLGNDALPAGKLIRQLLKSFESFDARRNIFVGVLLNLLLLWDLHCIWSIWQWNNKYSSKVEDWFLTLAETDALNAFASFAHRFPEYYWPIPARDGHLVQAEKLGHPLLDTKIRVDNDFTLDHEGKFYILTGPNMAGKSTFLRTVGINLVLANCGAPVCATRFQFRPHHLYTSMRTKDSLKDHTSYFYAELQRLREIMDVLHTFQPVIVLLDEILKGTNSVDKASGSRAVVRKMIHRSGAGIIATHDLSLGEMEKEIPDNVKNICFEAFRQDDQLRFDYLLRQGITRNMNATFLMQKMGIIDPD